MDEHVTKARPDAGGPQDRPLRGRWIALEGPDGGGKTYQIPRLVARLQAAGLGVVTTKEPGGVATFGKALRDYLFTENRIEGMSPEVQLLFFQADRAATVRDVIMPAVAAGDWVVCDRGPFGSTVYQGVVQGVDVEEVAKLTDWATGGVYPDLTLILDVSPEVALSRIAARTGTINWFDRWDAAHFSRVRNAYRLVAQAAANRCVVIEADATPDAVELAIWDAVMTRLAPGTGTAYSPARVASGGPGSGRLDARSR
jgi:dTMP kinase